MQTESLEDLSATNKSLRLQIEELSGTIACLEAENRMFLKDKECMKQQQKSLWDTVEYLKSTIEHLQKRVEDIREKLDHANKEVQELLLQNKSLVKANEDLNQEMNEVTSQVALFKDDKPAQENDLEEMRSLPSEVQKYLRSLEDKLAKMEHSYHVERIHSGQLKEKVTTLQTVREDRKKHIKELQNQQDLCMEQATLERLDQENQSPTGLLRHEQLEAKLMWEKSKGRKVLHCLWMAAKILMIFLFVCSLFLGLVLAYTHFFNPWFISDTLLVLLSDQSIVRLAHYFSPYLESKHDGLLPF